MKTKDLLTRVKKLDAPEEMEYSVFINTEKDKLKYINRIKSIVRGSMEYKDYIQYLRENVDMTKCAFFNNVDNKDNRRIKIEVHHEPFTLHDIVSIVINKWIAEARPLNDLYITDEIMDLHYRNMVGLIPLAKTVHNVVHNNSDAIIPLNWVYGDYNKFVKEYEDYISDEILDVLESKINKTKSIKEGSFDLFNKQFIYLEVNGVDLPMKIEREGEETA